MTDEEKNKAVRRYRNLTLSTFFDEAFQTPKKELWGPEQIAVFESIAAVSRLLDEHVPTVKIRSPKQTHTVFDGVFAINYIPEYEDMLQIVRPMLKRAEALYTKAGLPLSRGRSRLIQIYINRMGKTSYCFYRDKGFDKSTMKMIGPHIYIVPVRVKDLDTEDAVVHELAHYYHNEFIQGGIGNQAIQKAFSEVSGHMDVEGLGSEADNLLKEEKALAEELNQLRKQVSKTGFEFEDIYETEENGGSGKSGEKEKRKKRYVVVGKDDIALEKGKKLTVVRLQETGIYSFDGASWVPIPGAVLLKRAMSADTILLHGITPFRDRVREIRDKQDKVHTQMAALRASGSKIDRYTKPLSKWVATTYAKKNHCEWFAELLTMAVSNPSALEPDVVAWLKYVINSHSKETVKSIVPPKANQRVSYTIINGTTGIVEAVRPTERTVTADFKCDIRKFTGDGTVILNIDNQDKRLFGTAVLKVLDKTATDQKHETTLLEGSPDGFLALNKLNKAAISTEDDKNVTAFLLNEAVRQSVLQGFYGFAIRTGEPLFKGYLDKIETAIGGKIDTVPGLKTRVYNPIDPDARVPEWLCVMPTAANPPAARFEYETTITEVHYTFGLLVINGPDNKVLLVQPYGTKQLSIPSGKLEDNEHFQDTAIAEAHLQTGLVYTKKDIADEGSRARKVEDVSGGGTKIVLCYHTLFNFDRNGALSVPRWDKLESERTKTGDIVWAGFIDINKAKSKADPLTKKVLNSIPLL